MKVKTKNGLNKRKVQIFLAFLFCSFLIWLISKLSETYTERAIYELVFTAVPDSLLLTGVSKNTINTQIRTSGFQLLGSNFDSKQIEIDLSTVRKLGNRYFITAENYQRQLEQQLPGSITLLNVDTDTIYFNLFQLGIKKVPVKANINLQMAQNYLLKGSIKLSPDSIVIRGPEKFLDKIEEVNTAEITISEVADDFSRELKLIKDQGAEGVEYNPSSIIIEGEVYRFSEKIIEVPVSVINLPENTEVRTFPSAISVLCRGEIEQLKNLEASQFILNADYEDIKDGLTYLRVVLVQKPEQVQNAQLLQDQVEFILIRQ